MKGRDSIRHAVLAAMLLAGLPSFVLAGSAWAASSARAASPAPAEAPTDPNSLIAQSRTAVAKGDFDLAERMAEAAIVADPSRPSSYDALGDVCAGNHHPEFARNYYNEALSIDPADATAMKAIAALDREGDTRKADASDGAKSPIP